MVLDSRALTPVPVLLEPVVVFKRANAPLPELPKPTVLFCSASEPIAVLLVPVLEQVPLGESYDLIIGVDGSRVTNFLEFADRLGDVQPGEIVYLSVLRNGGLVQVPVQVPALLQRTIH